MYQESSVIYQPTKNTFFAAQAEECSPTHAIVHNYIFGVIFRQDPEIYGHIHTDIRS